MRSLFPQIIFVKSTSRKPSIGPVLMEEKISGQINPSKSASYLVLELNKYAFISQKEAIKFNTNSDLIYLFLMMTFAKSLFLLVILLITSAATQGLCFPPCTACQNGSTKCTSCVLGYMVLDSYCVSYGCKVLYCQQCSSSNFSQCLDCQANFLLINNSCICQGNLTPSIAGSPLATCICAGANNSCVTCSIPGCVNCQSSTMCSQCGGEYQSNGMGGCVICNVENCLTCQLNNFCQVCAANLTVTSTGQCISCNISSPGCIGCNLQGQCVCASGFQLGFTSNGTYCRQCNVPNCESCYPSPNVCYSCNFNYTVTTNGSCDLQGGQVVTSCPAICLTCSQYGACMICAPPRNPLTCVIENIPNCKSYYSNFTTCYRCQTFFTKASDGSSCSYNGQQFCLAFSSSYDCYQCQPFYTPVNGYCAPCQAGPGCSRCLSTNLSVCVVCIPGFYLQNNNCFACQPYCSSCNDGYTCENFLNSSSLPLFTTIDGNGYTVASCPSSCLNCNPTSLLCTSCQAGFYTSTQGICVKCAQSSNCLTCSSTNPSFCLSCSYPDFIPSGGIACVPCSPPCMNCDLNANITICIKCSIGYVLNNGTCTPSQCNNQYCMICFNGSCLQCLPGYFVMSNGSCLPGVIGCNNSMPANPAICQGCYPGSYLDLNTLFCVDCPENCLTCNQINTCLQCLDGYFLTGNINILCAPNCIMPCMSCIPGNPQACTSCLAGYYYSNGTCLATQCSQSHSCTYCSIGYGLNGTQACSPCQVSFCSTCNSLFVGCTGCITGYYLANGSTSCLPCPENCEQCMYANTCLVCAAGSTLLAYPLTQGPQAGICLPCTSPCQTCYGHPEICFSCVSGFFLFGTQCVTQTYYQGQINITSNFSTFFTNYQSLVAQIMQAVGINSYSQFFVTGAYPQFSFMASSNCSNSTNTTNCTANAINSLNSLFNSSQVANLTFNQQVFDYQTASNNQLPFGSNQCASPCQTCTVLGGSNCLSCPFGSVVKNSTCLNEFCPFLYCVKCLFNYTCAECLPTFTLINNQCVCQQNYAVNIFNSANSTCVCTLPSGNCSSCSVLNCISCSNATTCSACVNGFNLTINGTCLSCSIPNCVQCYVSNYCAMCMPGYLSYVDGSCVACNVSNCVTCYADNICSYCNIGFVLVQDPNTNTSSCIQCGVPNCMICNDSTTCQSCNYGYVLTNGSCQVQASNCEPPCLMCSSSTPGCQFCASPYSFLPSNGTCFVCMVPNCFICNETNLSACFSCSDGYILSSYTCIPQLGCLTAVNGSCTSCNNLYALTNFGTCLPCQVVQGCSACNSQNLTTCTQCQPGLFLANGTCSPCPPLCVSCNSTSCFNYSSSVLIVGDEVVIGTCLPPCQCIEGDPYVCTSCELGYYIINGTCMPCLSSSGCAACNSSNPSQCLSCPLYGGLVTINGTTVCQYCGQYCLICKGVSNCTMCTVGYQLVGGTCQQNLGCSQYCYICSSSGQNCLQCYPGYVPAGSSCVPGVSGCLISYPYDPSICEQCGPGTVLNPYTSSCIQCPLYCSSCSLTQVCMSCYPGYYLSGNQVTPCVPSCIYPCLSCSSQDPSLCFSCSGGYIFNSAVQNQCQPVTNCSNGCLVCPASFMLSNNSQCVACNSACLTCLRTAPNNCTSCLLGLYVDDSNQCVSCSLGCSNCTSGNLCLQCGFGYVAEWMYQGFMALPPVANCVACETPCQACFIRPDFCLSCISGYNLQGGQCLNNNYYTLWVTFTVNQTIFYGNYPGFIQQIVDTVAPNSPLGEGIIFPQSILSNSTTINYTAFISSQCQPSTQCSQQEHDNIQQLINSSQIQGMNVTSSFVNASFDYSSNQTNGTCPPSCLQCNSSNGMCTNCSSGFTIKNGICVKENCSVLYCQKCSSNNTCILCNSRFILTNNTCVCQIGWQAVPANSNNASCECNPPSGAQAANGVKLSQVDFCILCQVQNCLECTSSVTCITCAPPYLLNNQQICVLCTIPDCINCAQSNFCSLCSGSLQPSSAGDQCISCTIPNCLTCESVLQCASCLPGFIFNLEGTACINCTLANCVSCQGNNICGQCQPGYKLVNSNCQLSTCQFPCSDCSSGTSSIGCLSCVSPPFNPNPANGSCFTCNAANCLNCTLNNTSVCLSCQSSFQLVNGSCLAICIQPQCLSCSNSTFCLSCSLGYLLMNGSCSPCAPGCSSCGPSNLNTCTSCMGGFYQSNTTCLACPSFCSACDTNGSCIELKNQYVGQTLISSGGQVKLAICDQGCATCSNNNPAVCLACNPGFYLVSNICQPCNRTSFCKTCNISSPSTCLTCFANAFLTTGTCARCQPPCVTCSAGNLSACLSCPNGYLFSQQQCLPSQCPLYCSSCANQTYCLQCIDGYVSVNGVCTPCLQGCSQCSTTSPGLCIQCSTGTYLDSASYTCMGCSINCVRCLPGGCTSCLDGFYLTANLTCAPNCLSPCATCQSSDPSNCLSCIFGYTFNPGSLQNCQPDLSCNNTVSCTGCPLGFVLSNQQCFECSSNCARCLAMSPSTCTSCQSGQYLNLIGNISQCVACPSGCSSCLSSTTCISCQNGFTSLVQSSTGSPVQCAACETPCLTCQDYPSKCLTCQSGYSLINAKCISNFNFGFNCTLGVDNPTFYANYIPFLSVLSGNVGLDYGSVSIQSIKSSSTLVGGTVSTTATPQTSTSQTQFNNLLITLKSNSQIAGMQVISSSVTSNGGDPSESSSSSSRTWVIIVAVVVPLAVLVLVGIFMYCYCKKKRENSQPSNIQMEDSMAKTKNTEMSQIRKPMF